MYRDWDTVIRQQYAIAAGIQSGLFGKPRLTFEALFHGTSPQESDDTESHGLIPLRNFPHDTQPLSRESVIKLMEFSRERKLDLWTEERGKAAINEKDRLLSRVAQDDYLWKKWTYVMQATGVRPTLDLVRQWADNAVNEKLLTPPGYFIDLYKRRGKDPNAAWDQLLGESKHAIQEQLFQGMLRS